MNKSSRISSANISLVICLLFFCFNCLHQLEARTLAKTPRALSYIANQTVCMVDKVVYRDGDPIPTDDPCETCKCRPPGFSCVLRECEVKPGCKAIRREGECCPEYQCGCEHNGRFFGDGERVPYAESPCYTCHCQGSSITCGLADCKFRFDCEPEYVPGDCCPRYDHCPPEPTSTTTTTTTTTTTSTTTTSTTTVAPSSLSTEVSESSSEASTTRRPEISSESEVMLSTESANGVNVTESSQASTGPSDEATSKLTTIDAGESTSPLSVAIVDRLNTSTGNSSQVNEQQSNVIAISSVESDASTNSPSTVFEVNDSSSSMGVSDTTVASVEEASSTRDQVLTQQPQQSNDVSTSSNYPLDVATTMPSIAAIEVETNSPVTTVGTDKLTESASSINHSLSSPASSSSSAAAAAVGSVLSPEMSDDTTAPTTLPSQVINVSELKGQSQNDSMTAITIITPSSSAPPSSPAEESSSPLPLTTVNDNSQLVTELANNLSSAAAVVVDTAQVTTLSSLPSSSSSSSSSDSSNVNRDTISDITSPPATNQEEISTVTTATTINLANDEVTTDFPTTKAWVPDTALTKEHREGALLPLSNETSIVPEDSVEVTTTLPLVSSTQSATLLPSSSPSSTIAPDNLIASSSSSTSSPLATTINSVTIDKDEVVDVTTQSIMTPEITEVATSPSTL